MSKINNNVMGYFGAPAAPAPVAPAPVVVPGPLQPNPQVPGQQPVQQWDTWVPTSSADPYVAGMRTSGSALAAIIGSGRAVINARWETMLAFRAQGARASAKVAAAAGRKIGIMGRMTKAMKEASTVTDKGAILSKMSVRAGVGSAFKHTFLSVQNIGRALGGAAIIALPIAIISNMMDFSAGRINEQQRNALIVADTAGYTITGAVSTLLGGMLGATALGATIGAVGGVAAGFALGWVYEKYIRPRWGEWVRNSLYAPAPGPVLLEPK